jgi:hypothetical protein
LLFGGHCFLAGGISGIDSLHGGISSSENRLRVHLRLRTAAGFSLQPGDA